MMLNNIWLKTYITLVETKSFTKTADLLAMTQPGVSQHLQKLESYCGQALIKRYGKAFEITEQGKLVYDYALSTFKGQIDLLEQLSFDDKHSGVCRIACSGANALSLYEKLIAQQVKLPKLVCELEIAPNERILEHIQQGSIDLGIVNHYSADKGFSATRLSHEKISVVMAKAWQGTITSFDDLCQRGFINHPDGKHYLSMVFTQLDQHPSSIEFVPISGYINQLNQILLPVSKGLGFTVLPQVAIAHSPFKDVLCEFKLPKPISQPRYLVKKYQRDLPARFDSVMDLISEHFDGSSDVLFK
ncbi:LysR family transcriptional regulator [Pseudoalteromonas spongiae]|uniref:LysR family transcriptional regulator n=1 Tax=Pseudoalteromonas spongiae TaxID=298657 RepID=UPI0037357B71